MFGISVPCKFIYIYLFQEGDLGAERKGGRENVYLGENAAVDKDPEFALFEGGEALAPVLEDGVAGNGARVDAVFPEMGGQVVYVGDVDAEDERGFPLTCGERVRLFLSFLCRKRVRVGRLAVENSLPTCFFQPGSDGDLVRLVGVDDSSQFPDVEVTGGSFADL